MDDAATLGARFSKITAADNFLPDRALILAEAGRRDEALAQLTENLLRFPDDPWVIIKSGEVYDEFGEEEQAERFFRQGLELAGEDQYTRDGAVERLVPLLNDADRSEEANALMDAEEARRSNREKIRKSLLGETPSELTMSPFDPLHSIGDAAFPEDDETDFLSEPYFIRPHPKIGRSLNAFTD